MDSRRMKLFVDACECGSFSKVARKNGMTVQNVSKSIANLEQETGLMLFERSDRGVELTRAARALLPSAQQASRAVATCSKNAELIRVLLAKA